MVTNALMLLICYLLFKYTTSWIKYYNQLDDRMPDSLWRYTCDYPVVGIRDISDLDDKPFVTIMYFIVSLAFIFSNNLIAILLIKIFD